jgi:osmotically-inducible protein OsmY
MKTLKSKKWAHSAGIGRWSAILLMAAGMQTLVLPPLQAAAPKKEITDNGITAAVERELRLEKGVAPDLIDVSTSQGIVTLSGSADNLLAKERAVKIAESIRGVRGVIDRTSVTLVSRPDEDIRKDIMTALLQDPATASYQVAVSVQNAVATLSGSVGSYAEKQLAARIAKGVKGVKELRNEVTINYLAKRTDPEIAADIKARLQWDIWINGGQINPVVKDGNVTLTGTVGSALSHSRAFEDAWVNGVTSVDASGLKVDPNSRQDARRQFEYTISSDSEIKQAVLAALRLDPRVTVFTPEVTVEDGVVILGGEVGNAKAKTAADQDARGIVGVWRVDNLLKVRLKVWPSDAEMQIQLKAALAWDPLLDSSTIDVAVINRTAYLSGAVDSSFQKAEAQDVASRIKGVALVRNHLKVEPEFTIFNYDWPYYYSYYDWPYYNGSPGYFSETFGPQPCLSDEQIKKNIENAFFWSPFVHSDDITVSVDGGVATLTGTVGTWIGYEEADKDAHKGGATAVRDRLKVK